MRTIRKIVVHCSDSPFGDADEINVWHKQRWKASQPSGLHIGYHFVVLNGRRKTSKVYAENEDGLVDTGRPIPEVGAHAVGANSDSIGVCLIGQDGKYTIRQLHAAAALVAGLCRDHNVALEDVIGHCDVPGTTKTCPDLDMIDFRKMVEKAS